MPRLSHTETTIDQALLSSRVGEGMGHDQLPEQEFPLNGLRRCRASVVRQDEGWEGRIIILYIYPTSPPVFYITRSSRLQEWFWFSSEAALRKTL